MLLQNLHRCYLYVVIRLPKLKDLEQKIPTFLDCDNYGISRASNPNPTSDDEKRAIPVMAILQAGAAIGGTLSKGINALVDAKREKSFNNALKMVTANIELTH